MLSIGVLTYNHAKYIRQTLDSILAQKLSYSYSILIADDCSTDGTIELVDEYAKQFPNKITVLKREQNLGAEENAYDLFNQLDGKYAVFIEGDDYLIEPTKLQKQIDFLEANPDFVMAYNKAKVIREPEAINHPFPYNIYPPQGKKITTTADLIEEGCYLHTAAKVFRNVLKHKNPEVLIAPDKNGDYLHNLLLSDYGKIFFFDEIWSVYRLNSGGITNQRSKRYNNLLHYNALFLYSTVSKSDNVERALKKRCWYGYRLLEDSFYIGDRRLIARDLKKIVTNRAHDPWFSWKHVFKVFLKEYLLLTTHRKTQKSN